MVDLLENVPVEAVELLECLGARDPERVGCPFVDLVREVGTGAAAFQLESRWRARTRTRTCHAPNRWLRLQLRFAS